MRSLTRFVVVGSVLGVVCLAGVTHGAREMRLRVTADEAAGEDVPVCAVVDLPEAVRDVASSDLIVLLRDAGGRQIAPGQVRKLGQGKAELWWVVPAMKAHVSSTWQVRLFDARRLSRTPRPALFSWQDTEGQYRDLLFSNKRVTRYMYAHDTSSDQRRFETYKPFHQVYDGEQRLTNGPDGASEYIANQIRYPHHRGIFIGWNKLTFDGKRYDLWHMKNVEQVHQQFEETLAGPVGASSTALIHWNDDKGEPIVAERRQVTVYRQDDPTVTLLDFYTELTAVRGDVYLDGDPEHAGLQYRAHNDVAAGGADVKAKYLFHADGIDPRRDKDLPWVAMSYGLAGRRYSVQHMNHPDNPKDTIYSAYRDYARFGAFFKKTIKKGETLTLRYRIWVGRGELPSRADLATRYAAFANPPKVEASQ